VSIVLHPTAFTKQHNKYSGKLIPREEYNNFVSSVHRDTEILCVNWPKAERLSPPKHIVQKRKLVDICHAESLLPLTYSISRGSVEPQMIAQDTLYREDDIYLIECAHAAPVLINGRAIVYVSPEVCVAVNKLVDDKAFSAINHTGTTFGSASYSVSRHRNGAQPFIRFGVWDQPYRVSHVSAHMLLANGLILG
jgi:hypothetical protein